MLRRLRWTGDEHAGETGSGVGAPSEVGGVDHLVGGAFAQALLTGVDADRFDVAVTEVEGGGLLPFMGEAVDVTQLRNVVAGGREQRECSSCVHGLQLSPIADQQQLRPGGGCDGGESVKGLCAGEAGLIHDDELVLGEPGASSVVLVQPLGRVLTRDADVVGEHLRGGSGQGESDDAVGADPTPGGGDGGQGGGLPVTELLTVDGTVGDRTDDLGRHPGCHAVAGQVEQAVLGSEGFQRGVDD